MRRTELLPSLSNVAAGAQCTLNCPVGFTYDQIKLSYSGVTDAQAKNIRVKVNGKTIQEFKDFAEIDSINKYYGRNVQSGFCTLFFNRPEMATPGVQRLTGLGTLDVATLTVEIDIDAAAASPAIVATAVLSEPQPLGLIAKVRAFPRSFATTGQQDIDSIPRADRIAAIHFIKSDVSNVEVKLNSTVVYNATKSIGADIQKDYDRVPQTSDMTTVDFLLEGDITQALIMKGVQDFRVQPTNDTTGEIRTVVEYLGGLN
jgi:hypothetical protein